MHALARKPAVQSGLIVALLVALLYGLLTPAGSAQATGQGASGASGTPVAVGTPLASTPPAPPPAASPSPADPDDPAPAAPSAPPAPTPPTAPVAASATPQAATPTVAPRPRPPGTPQGTPTTAPATRPAPTPTATGPVAGPGPTAGRVPTATPTRPPSGTVSAAIVRDLSPLGFTLNGREQIAQATLDIAVSDTAPATRQPGWTLSLAVDQFRIAGSPARALPADAVTLLGVTVTCAADADCTMPENTIAYPRTMPAGVAVPIYAAAPGSGSGQFVVTPTFAVRVPATAYAGSYTTAIVVDAARGGPAVVAQGQGASAPVATATATTLPRPTPTAVAPTPTPFVAPTVAPTAPAPAPTVVPEAPEPQLAAASVAPEPSGEPPIAPTTIAPPPPPFPATDRIGTAQAVNLRGGPASTAPTQGLLPTGTRLAATGETRVVAGILWRCFTLADGRTGWVRDLDVLPVAH